MQQQYKTLATLLTLRTTPDGSLLPSFTMDMSNLTGDDSGHLMLTSISGNGLAEEMDVAGHEWESDFAYNEEAILEPHILTDEELTSQHALAYDYRVVEIADVQERD